MQDARFFDWIEAIALSFKFCKSLKIYKILSTHGAIALLHPIPLLQAAKVTKKGNSSDLKLPFLSLLALC